MVKRRFLKEKEAKQLLAEFSEKVGIHLQPLLVLKPPIETTETNGWEIFFIDREPVFARSTDGLFPTLGSDKLLSAMPKVVINMGAVPHVCNGADIMAPGIVRFEGTFKREDIVVVSDERHQKPIAIAIALYDVEEARKLRHGKILKNVHYVGDKLWRTMKQLSQTK